VRRSTRRCSRALAALGGLLLVAGASPAAADDDEHVVTAGAGAAFLLMLGPLSGSGQASVEASVEGALTSHYAVTAGARLQPSSGAPEAFVRFSSTAQLHAWLPALGLELGATGWSDDDSGGALLAEARASARRDLVPIYVAMHAAPLRFRSFERFSLSFLELQVGTHLSPFGRYLRLQLGLFAVGVVL
jgi:hypothetical protein